LCRYINVIFKINQNSNPQFCLVKQKTNNKTRAKVMWGYVFILFLTTCDYMLFATTFVTTYQLHQISTWFAIILRLMCNYYLLHPPMWMVLRLGSSMIKPPWPSSCTCNQNLITTWCTMYIMGKIRIHIWLVQFKSLLIIW